MKLLFNFEPSLTLWSLCRYLLQVMNVATPTKDCLELVKELLDPLMKARSERSLTRQEVTSKIIYFGLDNFMMFMRHFYLI